MKRHIYHNIYRYISGDIEAVYDLPTYSTTYNCLEAVTLYELDISSFIRLIVKKNPETFETMQKIVASKIRFRHSSIRGGIPLYAALMDSDKKLKSEGQPKFLPKLLVLQKKSKVQRQEYGKGRMQQERNKVASRWQKVKFQLFYFSGLGKIFPEHIIDPLAQTDLPNLCSK